MTSAYAGRTAHPYFMHDCILDQPAAIREVLGSQATRARQLAERVSTARRVHLVGIGTSWHAALVGEHLFRCVGGRDDARAWNSFEFWAYQPGLTAEDLVIVLSHRGTKRFSLRALELAKTGGAATALVTGQGSKGRLDLADVVLETTYGERSAAFTVSHTGAMTALAMVAVELAGGSGQPAAADLATLPHAVAAALSLEPQVREVASHYKGSQWFAFAGWGPNAPTAYEAALKVNEAAYALTTGFQIEQFLHGPFVATTRGCLVTIIAPPGPGYHRAVEIAKAVKETGAEVLGLVQEGDADMAKAANRSLQLPAVAEFLTPMVYLVPLQLFTYWLAVALGRNPDVFRLDDPAHAAARHHYEL